MPISLITAWLTVLCAVLAALKYFARISKNRTWNRRFSRIHIPFGVLMLVFGAIHGIFAGNMRTAGWTDFTAAPLLFTWNWGTACLMLGILLAVSWLLRRRLRKYWMPVHRVLTVGMLAVLVIHVMQVGIQIDDVVRDQLSGSDGIAVETQQSVQETETPEGSASADTEQTAAQEETAGSAETAQEEEQEPAVLFSGAELQDGTYEGSAEGYSGTITVSVTVTAGEVEDISVLSETDTPQFFSSAEGILDTIRQEQSLEVDAVSGATFSSAGLVNAVEDALQDAVTAGELQVTQFDLSSVSRHH